MKLFISFIFDGQQKPTGLFKLDFNSGKRIVTVIDVVGHLAREISRLYKFFYDIEESFQL